LEDFEGNIGNPSDDFEGNLGILGSGPWCDSEGSSANDSGESYMLLCGDDTKCHAIYDGWGCCEGRKGRARCPPHKPVMCARKCMRNTFHCCDTLANYCQGIGGPRYCPSTTYEVIGGVPVEGEIPGPT